MKTPAEITEERLEVWLSTLDPIYREEKNLPILRMAFRAGMYYGALSSIERIEESLSKSATGEGVRRCYAGWPI